MPQNELERRDYFQMQTEFRGEVRQQFTDLRNDFGKLSEKLGATQRRMYGAIGTAMLAVLFALLDMLLRGR